MLVMFDVTDPVEGKHAMTKLEVKPELVDVKALMGGDSDYLRSMVQAIVQATLEAEMRRRSEPRRVSGRRSGSATAAAITAAR